jgi:hypothetical protein
MLYRERVLLLSIALQLIEAMSTYSLSCVCAMTWTRTRSFPINHCADAYGLCGYTRFNSNTVTIGVDQEAMSILSTAIRQQTHAGNVYM